MYRHHSHKIWNYKCRSQKGKQQDIKDSIEDNHLNFYRMDLITQKKIAI